METSLVEQHMEFTPKAYREFFFRRQVPMFLFAVCYTVFLILQLGGAFLDFPFLPLRLQLLLLLCVGLSVLMYAQPFLRYYVTLRRFHGLYGRELPHTDIRFGDVITVDSAGNHMELPYDWVKKTRVYRYSYILVMKDRRSLRVQYDSFTKGDLDTLRSLLRERCPNLKKVK